jgi:hypothetical protein
MLTRLSFIHRLAFAGIACFAVVGAFWLAIPVGLAPVRAQTDPTTVPTDAPPALPAFPTETRIPVALSGVWGIAGSQNIAIRSGPGTAFPRVGFLRAGRSIDITGTNGFDAARPCSAYFENDLDMWVEVRFSERVGWMARCTLTIRGDLSKLPIEAPPPSNFAPPIPTPFAGAAG